MQGYLLSTLIDCTEQRQLEAVEKHTALARFSGKKGFATWMKFVTCSPRQGLIYTLSPSYLGANNDPTIYKHAENYIEKNLQKKEAIGGDAAFCFILKSHKIFTSNPKAKTKEEKELNVQFVSVRLVIEQVFGVLKKQWKILHHTFRHDKQTHEQAWYILCSLHNERINAGKLELRGSQFWQHWEKKWEML